MSEEYRETRDEDSMESWNKHKDQMTPEQDKASWQRGIEYRSLTAEQRELLKNVTVTLEVGERKLLENGDYTWPIVMKGKAEGHDILLNRQVVPRKVNDFPAASRGDMTGMPESDKNAVYSSNDKYSGEVDGKQISPEEAEKLWKKYGEVADVITTDQELAETI